MAAAAQRPGACGLDGFPGRLPGCARTKGSAMKEATRQKFQRQAEPFLNAGERVEAAVDGSSSALAYWMLGAVIYLGIGRAVLVTDKGVYVCKRNAAGLGSVIARYPSKSVKLELQG